ncbi:MAG: hypothetical protein IJW42_07710 [Alistipes sp.]|nr:hypothetical protein [Alistipes sp.]MBQ7343123.1 hypothetical protein [Alistipes sp.]
MKKLFKTIVCVALGAMAFTACESDNGGEGAGELSAKETALKAAVNPYIDNVVIPTYKGMADNALLLAKKCNEMLEAGVNGITVRMVEEAQGYWLKSRDYWEKSEAFLFGAAADYNIDPHIDSWPLDHNKLQTVLNLLKAGQNLEAADFGNGLLGFHSIEYMLFELSADGTTSSPRTTFAAEELVFLAAVADDLAQQCALLEQAWAGEVSAEKAAILEAAELEASRNYGDEMKNAGQAGSLYKTYQEAAEEIIDGCVTIADEVANTKMGAPYRGVNGQADGDRNYIESPYSLNSIVDFVGNIISIENVYEGKGVEGGTHASISGYVKGVNPTLDTKVLTLIAESKTAISAIPEPFAKNAGTPTTKSAIDKVNELVAALEEVASELAKNY